MKIAFVATGTPEFDDFPDPSAGSSAQEWALAVEFSSRGHDVAIFRGTFGRQRTWETRHEITIVDIPAPSIDAILNGMFTKLLFSYRVRSQLRKRGPDVVFMRERHTAVFPARSDLDTLYTVESPDSFPFFRSFSTSKHVMNYILYPYKDLIERHVLGTVDTITTISRDMRDYLREREYENTEFVGVCINPDDFPAKAELSDDRILLFAGRLVKLKRAEWALDAYAGIDSDEFELHFAGEGPRKQHLQDCVAEYGLENEVTFHGWLNRKNLLELMGRASVLVHPSKFEMGGNVVLEAMASGCPVVAGNVMGPRTLISHGETGFIFDRDDRSELRSYLRDLVADRSLRTEMGAAARERALTNFDATTVADRFLRAYASSSNPE